MPAVLVAVGLALGGGTTALASTTGSLGEGGLTEADRILIAAVESDPTDFARLDELSLQLFGTHYYVAFGAGTEEVTGTEASRILQRDPARSPSEFGILSLPTDTFSISIGRASVSSGVYVTGSVVFKATYAGQAAPTDVSSIQVSAPSCVLLSNHSINTYNGTGTSTNLGYLSDANVSAKSPIWRINDYTSGFVNQAHRSSASVLLSKSGCATATVSTAYRYEHNQGGAISSISASFGLLSVSYSTSPLSLQKSSSVLNFSF